METWVEKTLEPGKLVREAPEELRRVLISEAQPGEVVVSLLETATDEQLRSGGARIWVALTDRRAAILAADSSGDSYFKVAEPSTVSRKGRLGRDELTIGDRVLKCPLLRGGSEFKQFAKLAETHRIERLRTAARERLDEDHPEVAAVLAEAGLNYESDPTLHSLRVIGLVRSSAMNELGNAMVDLVKSDRDLTHWEELYETIQDDGQVLWLLYQAAQEVGIAQKIRSRLDGLRHTSPSDSLTAELVIAMDADDGELDAGLDRAVRWRHAEEISAKTFLSACTTLAQAGLDTEPLHRLKAMTLAELGKIDDALISARRALELDRTAESLRVMADLSIRGGHASDAVEPLEQLLELGADDAWIRSMLANGYEAQQRFDEALSTREIALEHLLATDPEPEHVAAERRSLARLHRSISSSYSSEERDIRLACAELLERGLDWAARLDAPRPAFTGTTLHVSLEILAARRLTEGDVFSRLSYQEEIIDPKAERQVSIDPPSLLAGGITGVWSPSDMSDEAVQAGKRSARARYDVGDHSALHIGRGLGRGLHRMEISVDIPREVRPSYTSDRVRGQLELEITPPKARFPIEVAPCHDREANAAVPEERVGQGKHDISAIVQNSLWSFSESPIFEVKALLKGEKLPTRIDANLIATERMRPPKKGERIVESLSWSFPLFPYELREGVIDRKLSLDLPREGDATGIWTWFELLWHLEVKLMRKEKADATVEIPIFLKYGFQSSELRDQGGKKDSEAGESMNRRSDPEAEVSGLAPKVGEDHDPKATLPHTFIPITEGDSEE